jgi:parallel beta-helix repeat protein
VLIIFLALIIAGCNTVTFLNLLVENSGRSGIDFIGCNNIKISNLEAKNNGRAGIAVKDSKQCNNEQYYY